jgi:hypothetical protein
MNGFSGGAAKVLGLKCDGLADHNFPHIDSY